MKKTILPVKKEFEYSVELKSHIHPFTIAFIYPQQGSPYVIKGDGNQVHNYITNKVKEDGACLVNLTYWRDKKAEERTCVYGLEDNVGVTITKEKKHGTRRFRFSVTYGTWGSSEFLINKMIRRRPRKWLKDLDAFVKEKE